ncbi:MAG: hypothetical protein AB7S75_15340 [Desulfococcaceae bacterium]
MENIPGKFQKTVKTCMLPQPEKRQGNWTLLLVEDSGRSIHIRWYKAWAAIAVLVLAAASGTAGFCYYMYHKVSAENLSLRVRMDKADTQNPLLAQSGQPASKAAGETENAETAALPPSSNAEKSGKPDMQISSDKTGESDTPSSSEKAAEMTAQDKTDGESAGAEKSAVPPFPDSRVSVGDFACSFSEHGEGLNIRFHILNTDPEAGPVSGQVFVILKTEKEASAQWLLLPDEKRISGKLPEDAAGESFSISRFRSVEMRAKGSKKPDEYKTATVIVSDENRNIMLEEDFPVAIGKPS